MLLKNEEVNFDSNNFLEKKSYEIKNKIRNLQFPKNCKSVKKLVCEVEPKCGFMCQLHFLILCFIHAYYQNRAVIFKDLQTYNPDSNRFQDSYLPFSDCTVENNQSFEKLKADGKFFNKY